MPPKELNPHGWDSFFEIVKEMAPNKLLVDSIPFVEVKGKAIELGAGTLRDTGHLLDQGFEDVTVLDVNPQIEKFASELGNEKVHVVVSTVEGFDFPIGEYDLVSAINVLPFGDVERFDEKMMHIKMSLKKRGIFTGSFWGDRDSWKQTNPQRTTFLTREQVEKLFSDMEVIILKETESDGQSSLGVPKHWHVFRVIARKR